MLSKTLATVILACALLFNNVNAELPQVFGSDFVGRGFDATTMEHKTLPVVKLTFEGGDKWINPFDGSQAYRVPQEMIVQDNPIGSFSNFTSIFQDEKDYQKDIRRSSHHSGFLGFGSRSKETRHFVHNHYERKDAMSYFHQYASYYKLSLFPLPPPEFHEKTAQMIEALPDQYISDNTTDAWHAYRDFIAQVGTHYVDSAEMGGAFKMVTYFHSCFLSMHSEDWVREQSGWSFLGIINNKKGFQKYEKHIDQNWQEYHEAHVQLLGGFSNLFSVTDYDEWLQTVQHNLTPLFYSITPISELITDPAKAKSMQDAISDYMSQGQKELVDLVDSIPKDHHQDPEWCKPF